MITICEYTQKQESLLCACISTLLFSYFSIFPFSILPDFLFFRISHFVVFAFIISKIAGGARFGGFFNFIVVVYLFFFLASFSSVSMTLYGSLPCSCTETPRCKFLNYQCEEFSGKYRKTREN